MASRSLVCVFGGVQYALGVLYGAPGAAQTAGRINPGYSTRSGRLTEKALDFGSVPGPSGSAPGRPLHFRLQRLLVAGVRLCRTRARHGRLEPPHRTAVTRDGWVLSRRLSVWRALVRRCESGAPPVYACSRKIPSRVIIFTAQSPSAGVTAPAVACTYILNRGPCSRPMHTARALVRRSSRPVPPGRAEDRPHGVSDERLQERRRVETVPIAVPGVR